VNARERAGESKKIQIEEEARWVKFLFTGTWKRRAQAQAGKREEEEVEVGRRKRWQKRLFAESVTVGG
jgi:hypothetical protein